MDLEYHYWFTGLIAHKAGFTDNEAQTIAYASQYVDDNDKVIEVKTKGSKSVYKNQISQTMNILKPKHDLLKIYPFFHFIPGEPTAYEARRRDGKIHLLNTTPNGPYAQEILDSAFKASDDIRLYRIGIATHAFVDSWAHQNFVGCFDSFNDIGHDPKPNIGHADAEHHPDWVSHLWEDSRLVESEVDNINRFLSASEALFKKYCNYLKVNRGVDNSSKWNSLKAKLVELQGTSYTGWSCKYECDRAARYQQHINWLTPYDEHAWLNDAVASVRKKQGRPGSKRPVYKTKYSWREDVKKEGTDWFKFQEAVKEHVGQGENTLNEVFASIGVDIEGVKKIV
jgi:hypothetical protein